VLCSLTFSLTTQVALSSPLPSLLLSSPFPSPLPSLYCPARPVPPLCLVSHTPAVLLLTLATAPLHHCTVAMSADAETENDMAATGEDIADIDTATVAGTQDCDEAPSPAPGKWQSPQEAEQQLHRIEVTMKKWLGTVESLRAEFEADQTRHGKLHDDMDTQHAQQMQAVLARLDAAKTRQGVTATDFAAVTTRLDAMSTQVNGMASRSVATAADSACRVF
jgi:hypothetical protein